MQRGGDPLGDDPGGEAPWRAFGDASREDQADLPRSAQVEILADDRLEQVAARKRALQHVGAGKLRLQNRELIAVTGGPIRGRERMRQTGEPLAHHRLETPLIESIENRVQALGIGTGAHPVVECRERDAGFRELALGILMAIETDPYGRRISRRRT